MKTQLLAVAIAAAAGACEPTWFAVEVQATEVCVVEMPVVFPPAALATEMETSITRDDLGLDIHEALDLDIAVSSAAMAPAAGADLDFADQIDIRIASLNDPELPLVPLVELSASDLAPEGGLYGEPEDRVDVTAYIQASDVVFELELAGGLPELPVAATLDLCLDITASYSETAGDSGP